MFDGANAVKCTPVVQASTAIGEPVYAIVVADVGQNSVSDYTADLAKGITVYEQGVTDPGLLATTTANVLSACSYKNGYIWAGNQQATPSDVQYCGRFICAAHTGVQAFLVDIAGSCKAGSGPLCNNNLFSVAYDCLSTLHPNSGLFNAL
jgi:hypothetical protein